MLVLTNWQHIRQTENIPSSHTFQHHLVSTAPLLYLAPCCLSQDLNSVIFSRPSPVSQIWLQLTSRLKTFQEKIIENWTSKQIMESHSIVLWGKQAFIWLMPYEIQIFCEWTTEVWKLWFSGLESAAIFAVSIYTLFLGFCVLNVKSKKANGPISLAYIYII